MCPSTNKYQMRVGVATIDSSAVATLVIFRIRFTWMEKQTERDLRLGNTSGTQMSLGIFGPRDPHLCGGDPPGPQPQLARVCRTLLGKPVLPSGPALAGRQALLQTQLQSRDLETPGQANKTCLVCLVSRSYLDRPKH